MLKKQHIVMLLLAGLTALPAAAGPADTLEVEGRRVVVEVDRDGRLVVDGRVVRAEGPVVLRIGPAAERHHVVHAAPGRAVIVHGLGAESGGDAVHVFRHDGFDEDALDALRRDVHDHLVPALPGLDVAPLLEGLRPSMERLRRQLHGDLQQDREILRMERETREVARAARRADGPERERLQDELRARLEDLFARKMQQRQDSVDRLAEELGEQQERLERRRAAREQIIERRIRALMGDEDVLEW